MQGEQLCRRAIDEARQRGVPGHPDTAAVLFTSAELLRKSGKHADAAGLLREVVELRRQKLGDDHLDAQEAVLALAQAEQAVGKADDARVAAEAALTARRERLGPDDLRSHAAATLVADILQQQRQFDAAETLLRKSVERHQSALPPSDMRLWNAHTRLIDLLLDRSDSAAASVAIENTRQTTSPGILEKSWRHAELSARLGEALSKQRRFEEAERLLLESLCILRSAWGPSHSTVRQALARMVRHYEATGEEIKAREYRELLDSLSRSPASAARLMCSSAPS